MWLQAIFAAGIMLLTAAAPSWADVPVVTVLADFEDDSVAASVSDVVGVLAGDCELSRGIPARGVSALIFEIGAVRAHAAAAFTLQLRQPVRFRRADRVAAYCYLKEGSAAVAFRVRDADGRMFETSPRRVDRHHHWMRVESSLQPGDLRPVEGEAKPVWPVQVDGMLIQLDDRGKQVVHVDDLQVEHRVPRHEVVRPQFRFDHPTKIYDPGETVSAVLELENRSREERVQLSIETEWRRPDGVVLDTQRDFMTLPTSGLDFRSRQQIEMRETIAEPGLYQLVSQVRSVDWGRARRFETTIAVMPNNRDLPRRRQSFFGLRSNLMREPVVDQLREIDVAHTVGAQLLAIDVAWAGVEPKEGDFDFKNLDIVIEAIVERNMAPALILHEPPGWSTISSKPLVDLLSGLLDGLIKHYGPRVAFYQLGWSCFPGRESTAVKPLVDELQRRVSLLNDAIRVVRPPLPADAAADVDPDAATGDEPAAMRAFLSRGASSCALAELIGDEAWRESDWWMHEADPVIGAGGFADAEALLRHYVLAATKGIAGLLWFDLRDDDNHPHNAAGWRGLVRRDFSPKTALVGFATAVGELSGLGYNAPVYGTPDGFASALFIGSERHVAVFVPRPNRVLPAVVMPVRVLPGEFVVHDFERRLQPLLTRGSAPLVQVRKRPFFVTLALETAQPEPQIGLAPSWLRVPGTVFVGAENAFAIEVDALQQLRRSYFQIVTPESPRITSSVGSKAVRAEAGETQRFDVQLDALDGLDFDQAELVLRFNYEGDLFDVPLTARPLVEVRAYERGTRVGDADYRLASLRREGPGDDASENVSGSVHATYDQRGLQVAVALPASWSGPSTDTGEPVEIRLGVAVEGRDSHVEVRAVERDSDVRLTPQFGLAQEDLRRWRARAVREGDQVHYRLSIPVAVLGLEQLNAGQRLLMAVRCSRGVADGGATEALRWGQGLNGERASRGYQWVRLGALVAD